MNRRSFFKFLPIAPFVLAAEGARACIADGAPIPTATQIVLSGNKKPDPVKTNTLGFSMPNGNDPNKQVSIAVGDDGYLWLKSKNGEWKRVVTE